MQAIGKEDFHSSRVEYFSSRNVCCEMKDDGLSQRCCCGVYRCGGVWPWQWPLLTALPCRAPVRVLLSLCTGVAACGRDNGHCSQLCLAVPRSVYRYSCLCVQVWRCVAVTTAAAHSSALPCPSPCTDTPVSVYRCGGVWPWQRPLLTALPCRAPVRVQILLSLCTGVAACGRDNGRCSQLCLAVPQSVYRYSCLCVQVWRRVAVTMAAAHSSALPCPSPCTDTPVSVYRCGGVWPWQRPLLTALPCRAPVRVQILLSLCTGVAACGRDNGRCSQLCLAVPQSVYRYSCLCVQVWRRVAVTMAAAHSSALPCPGLCTDTPVSVYRCGGVWPWQRPLLTALPCRAPVRVQILLSLCTGVAACGRDNGRCSQLCLAVPRSVYRYSCLCVQVWRRVAVTMAAAHSSALPCPGPCTDTPVSVYRCGGVWPWQWPLLTALPCRAPVRVQILLSLCTGVAACGRDNGRCSQLCLAVPQSVYRYSCLCVQVWWRVAVTMAAAHSSALPCPGPCTDTPVSVYRCGGVWPWQWPLLTALPCRAPVRVQILLSLCTGVAACGHDNGRCSQLCLAVPQSVYRYSCLCVQVWRRVAVTMAAAHSSALPCPSPCTDTPVSVYRCGGVWPWQWPLLTALPCRAPVRVQILLSLCTGVAACGRDNGRCSQLCLAVPRSVYRYSCLCVQVWRRVAMTMAAAHSSALPCPSPCTDTPVSVYRCGGVWPWQRPLLTALPCRAPVRVQILLSLCTGVVACGRDNGHCSQLCLAVPRSVYRYSCLCVQVWWRVAVTMATAHSSALPCPGPCTDTPVSVYRCGGVWPWQWPLLTALPCRAPVRVQILLSLCTGVAACGRDNGRCSQLCLAVPRSVYRYSCLCVQVWRRVAVTMAAAHSSALPCPGPCTDTPVSVYRCGGVWPWQWPLLTALPCRAPVRVQILLSLCTGVAACGRDNGRCSQLCLAVPQSVYRYSCLCVQVWRRVAVTMAAAHSSALPCPGPCTDTPVSVYRCGGVWPWQWPLLTALPCRAPVRVQILLSLCTGVAACGRDNGRCSQLCLAVPQSVYRYSCLCVQVWRRVAVTMAAAHSSALPCPGPCTDTPVSVYRCGGVWPWQRPLLTALPCRAPVRVQILLSLCTGVVACGRDNGRCSQLCLAVPQSVYRYSCLCVQVWRRVAVTTAAAHSSALPCPGPCTDTPVSVYRCGGVWPWQWPLLTALPCRAPVRVQILLSLCTGVAACGRDNGRCSQLCLAVPQSVYRYSCLCVQVWRCVAVTMAAAHSSALPCPSPCTDTPVSVYRCGGVWPWQWPLLTALPCRAPVRVQILLSLCTGVAACGRDNGRCSQLCLAVPQSVYRYSCLCVQVWRRVAVTTAAAHSSALPCPSPCTDTPVSVYRCGGVWPWQRPLLTALPCRAPVRVQILLSLCTGVAACGRDNGRCSQLCLAVPRSVYRYSCHCNDGFHTDPHDHRRCLRVGEWRQRNASRVLTTAI